MTWPIPTLPVNYTNATEQADAHPAAHNAANDAINELYARLPRGYVAHVFLEADQTIPGGYVVTDLTGFSVSWIADPTRRYCVMMRQVVQKITNAGDVFGLVRNAAGATIVSSAASLAVNGLSVLTAITVESGLSGSQTRKVSVSGSTASTACLFADKGGMLLVEDIGKV